MLSRVCAQHETQKQLSGSSIPQSTALHLLQSFNSSPTCFPSIMGKVKDLETFSQNSF